MSVFLLPNMSLLYGTVGVLLVLIAFSIVLAPVYFHFLYSSFIPDLNHFEASENMLHLNEWLNHWSRKEKKILMESSQPK